MRWYSRANLRILQREMHCTESSLRVMGTNLAVRTRKTCWPIHGSWKRSDESRKRIRTVGGAQNWIPA